MDRTCSPSAGATMELSGAPPETFPMAFTTITPLAYALSAAMVMSAVLPSISA